MLHISLPPSPQVPTAVLSNETVQYSYKSANVLTNKEKALVLRVT